MKFLTICEGGCVRSVALAYLLRQQGQDAIPVSARWNTVESIEALSYHWADYVILLAPEWKEKLPADAKAKCWTVDIGPDRWGACFHGELLATLAPIVAAWKNVDFDLRKLPR